MADATDPHGVPAAPMPEPVIPDEVKYRLVFELAPDDHRAFFWFHMRGDDLYWGSMGNGFDADSQPFDGLSAKITVPDDLRERMPANLKASWHESGRAHLKRSTRPDERTGRHWGDKHTLERPRLIATVLSKAPELAEPYTKSLDRKDAAAVVFDVPLENRASRHYFEFYLCPPGQFAAPATVLRFDDFVEDRPPLLLSLAQDLILAIRRFPLGGPISTWHPDLQIWLHVDTPPEP